MIDWNDNAKAAVREFADYIGQSDKFERYLEHMTTKKTVADAVEWAGGKWGNSVRRHIAYNPNSDRFTYSETGEVNKRWYIVCTRAEFEAYVKEQEAKKKYPPITQSLIDEAEQEAEKWTHEYHGDNCKIVHQKKWQAWIVSENGLSKLVPISELRKPKPTMSESEAWRYCVEEDVSPGYVMSLYDVVKD
tara:strand:+ start:1313 stop:1882 length:570 start_codon:yes stop_codon:yes gene_type:complete